MARQRRWRLSTHVAESESEFDMFMYRRGPLFEWLEPQRDMTDCGHGSPVRHLARQNALGPEMLAVHVNYLWDHDAELLGETATHVVHCPRSHAYFGHRRFPRRELEKASVNICLGTDSLVSTLKPRSGSLALDMFAEMRCLASKSSDLEPESIVRMATVHGARSLGLEGQVGEIRTGAFADMIAIPFRGRVADVFGAILAHEGSVGASMIDGKWAVEPEALAT
jgi:cytosine/adenosine deaminase-related metal-dependent hydrolase